MAITEPFQSSNGSWATEYFLAAASTTQGAGQSDDGVYQLVLDLNAMLDGDEYRVRVWDAISSGGTVRIGMEWVVAHAQSEPLWFTPSLILLHKWDFSIIRLAGSDRTIAWSIRKVA